MERIEGKLKKLKEEDKDVSLVLDAFKELDAVYKDTLRATEFTKEVSPVMNSSFKMSFQPHLSHKKITGLNPIRTDLK